jgi:N-methylhydantoinase A
VSVNWQVGIDIGGTFTDVVACHAVTNEVRSAKVPTQIDDRVAGLISALKAVDLEWADVDDLVLGTTMVTNAIVENDLAEVALVATEGFSDTLAIGRQNRRHLYRLDLPPKIATQVPAARRFGIAERLDHRGQVLKPLTQAAIDSIVEKIAASGAKAVAVSLLHSYTDSSHEDDLGHALRQRFPYVALSSQVNPEAREYERTATTVLSASVMPLAAGHLDQLEAIKPAAARLHLFHSAGGMASPAALRDLPLGLAMSGPAAGVAAAGEIARQLNIKQALSFDMGGTTTDVCLLVDAQAKISSNRSLGERPMRLPMVAVDSIGAGGGSIARLEHGALLVGPESAGAHPGPACYARGGTHATVSDANLVLGYLDASQVLGNDLHLNLDAATAAIKPLADSMGMSVEAASLGIVRVANSTMIRALRRITVEQGIDGRQCTLLAYGGAGPMHAADVARDFGITSVVIPAFSSMFSALGCVSAQMSYTRQQTLRMKSLEWDAERLNSSREALLARLTEHLADPLESAGLEREQIIVNEVAMIRYSGQSYSIEVADPDFNNPDALGAAFKDLHNKLYGFSTDETWELESVRMSASLPRTKGVEQLPSARSTATGQHKSRTCVFNNTGPVDTPCFERSALPANQLMAGPMIVEDACSTVIVPPGTTLNSDDNGNLLMSTGECV